MNLQGIGWTHLKSQYIVFPLYLLFSRQGILYIIWFLPQLLILHNDGISSTRCSPADNPSNSYVYHQNRQYAPQIHKAFPGNHKNPSGNS